jgi:DUF917 family protein
MRLTDELVQAAAFGGAVLGGGGGGDIETGIRLGLLALEVGQPRLVSLDEMEDQAMLVTVSSVGAPSAPDQCVEPTHYVQALRLLMSYLDSPVSGLITNENGGLATLNGWFQSAVTGLPVVDAPCNGRAHPTGLMGAMGLNAVAGYTSRQAAIGGSREAGRYVRLYVEGSVAMASRLVRRAAEEAGGMAAVARNPAAAAYVRDNAAIGALQQALEVGRTLLAAPGPQEAAESVCTLLNGDLICQTRVLGITLHTRGGFDVGRIEFQDGYELTVWNEFMTLEKHDKRLATFPDLITSLSIPESRPLNSTDLRKNQHVQIIRVPHKHLRLGSGMRQPGLFRAIERAVGKDVIRYVFPS